MDKNCMFRLFFYLVVYWPRSYSSLRHCCTIPRTNPMTVWCVERSFSCTTLIALRNARFYFSISLYSFVLAACCRCCSNRIPNIPNYPSTSSPKKTCRRMNRKNKKTSSPWCYPCGACRRCNKNSTSWSSSSKLLSCNSFYYSQRRTIDDL